MGLHQANKIELVHRFTYFLILNTSTGIIHAGTLQECVNVGNSPMKFAVNLFAAEHQRGCSCSVLWYSDFSTVTSAEVSEI